MIDEKNFGKGGIKDLPDARDVKYEHVAMGSAPFDWSVGFDIEAELAKLLNIPNWFLKTKNQNGSGSCGGQAWSYYGSILEAVKTSTWEERSAKFIYSQTFVLPAGSAGRDNCGIAIKQGWGTEELTPSYDGGNPPGEAFMQRPQDITQAARDLAKISKALLYANVAPNIDLFAQAIRDNNGLVLGIYGKNNGTWSGKFPKPPIYGVDEPNTLWAHWLYAGKAKIIDGKKHIAVKNSWGDDVGDHGWQWLSEDYFKPVPVLGSYIWLGWTMIFKGADSAFSHFFFASLHKGSVGAEVVALQTALNLEGMFTGVIDGKFGKITEAAVKNFQARYSLGVDGLVGSKTNKKLNDIYNK